MTEQKQGKKEIIADTRTAITVLYNSGMLAKDEEEARVLTIWRKMPEKAKEFMLGILTGATMNFKGYEIPVYSCRSIRKACNSPEKTDSKRPAAC